MKATNAFPDVSTDGEFTKTINRINTSQGIIAKFLIEAFSQELHK